MAFRPSHYITGEYAVGTTCFSVVEMERKELLGDADGNRKIAIRMYYPVDKDSVRGREKACIFSANKEKAVRKAFHIKTVDAAMNVADYYEDIPMIEDQRFPLILFSHGYNSYVEANTFLCCDLASHGYIVASIGHAFEAVENDYDDGSYDLYDKKINKMMYTSMIGAILAQNKLLKKQVSAEDALDQFDLFQNKYTPYIKDRVIEWAKDMRYGLAEIKQRFGDRIDPEKGIGVSGHSLGGCVAYYLCRYFEEFTCGINIDGGLFGDYPDAVMEKPFCQISCRENINVETRPLLHTNAPTYHVIFDNMKHIGFTDAKFFIPIKSMVGKMDSDAMYNNLAYCHYTFFDKYLKGKDQVLVGMGTENVKYRKVR